jgi:uncharacterized membrane protein YgcG
MSEAFVIGVEARLAWQVAFRDAVEILQRPYIDEVKRRLADDRELAQDIGPINGPGDVGNLIATLYFDLKKSWQKTRLYPIYGVLIFIQTEPELKHQLPMALETLQKCFHYAAAKVAKEIKSSREEKTYIIDGMPNQAINFQNYKFNPLEPSVIDDLITYLSHVILAARLFGTHTSIRSVFQMITIAEDCWITSYLANPHALGLGRNESARLRNRFMKEAVLIAKLPLRRWDEGVFTNFTYVSLVEQLQREKQAAEEAAESAASMSSSASASSPVATDVKSVNPMLSRFGRPVVPIGFRPAGPAYQSFPTVNNGTSSSISSSSSSSSSGSGSGSGSSSSGVSKMDISKTGGNNRWLPRPVRLRFLH